MAIISGTLLALKGAGALMAKKTAAVAAKGAAGAATKGALATKLKGKVKSIAKDKLLGRRGKPGGLIKRGSISSALVKTETTNIVKQDANITTSRSSGGNSLLNEVIEIKITTIKIKDLLASNLAKQKAADDAARIQAEKDRKAARESELESGAGGGAGGMKMPKGPKVGPFEAIKRFLLMTFLGSLLGFLLKHHKKVLAVFNFITKNITASIKIFLALRKLFKMAVKSLLKSVLGLGKKLFTGALNLVGKAIKKTGSLVLDALKTAANALYNFLKATIEAAIKFAQEVAKGVSKLGKEFIKRGAQVSRYLKRVYRAATGAIKGGKGAKGAIDAIKTATQRSAQAASKRVAQEAAEKVAKEAAEKVGQEAIEKVGQEAIEKVGQEAAEKVAKEAAEKVAQEAAEKVAKEAAEKVVQEGAEQVAKKAGKSFLSRIPFLGGLITAIVSLASGEPVTQAIFKTAGAVLGGFLGSFIPIPVIGTLIGEILGEYVGDLFYTGLMGGGMDAVGKKLQEDITSLLKAGKFVADWIGDGFGRLNEGIPSYLGVKNYLVLFNPIESVPLFYKAFFTRDSMTEKKEKEPEVEQKFLGGVVNAAKSFLGVSSKKGEESGSISTSGLVKEPKKLPGISLSKIPLKNQETYLGIRYKNNAFSKGLASIFGGGSMFGGMFKSNDGSTTSSSSSSATPGTAGGAISPSQLYAKIGANEEQWNIFRNSVALIESGGDYSIPGGSGNHYDGRYQMGEAAKKDGSRYAGIKYPGHSDDPNAPVRVAYRANKELQEAIFTGFTLANHTYLMGNQTYKASSIERKLQILGYAHNQGMGGAENWITTGVVGSDGFGTKGTKYTDLIAANFRSKKSGGNLEVASGAISSSGSVSSESISSESISSESTSSENTSSESVSSNNNESTSEKKPDIKKVYNPDGTLNFNKTFIHKDLMAGGTFGGSFNQSGGATKSEDSTRGEGGGEGGVSKVKPSRMKIGPGSKVARSSNIAPTKNASFGSINVKNYQIQESAHYDEPSAQIILLPPPQQSAPPQRKMASNVGKANVVMPLFTLNRDINDIVSQAAFY